MFRLISLIAVTLGVAPWGAVGSNPHLGHCYLGPSNELCGRSRDNDGKCFPRTSQRTAASLCAGIGARLCTAAELRADEAADTGCLFNIRRMWTSTECSAADGPGRGFTTLAGASRWSARHAEECSAPAEEYYFRCCYAREVARGAYKIRLRNMGGFSDAEMEIFREAARRWENKIVGLAAGSPVNVGMDEEAFQGRVQGLLIDVTAKAIDGVGGILGSAGPIAVRGDSLIPYYGEMTLDEADVARIRTGDAFGREALLSVATHETAHVLGLGTTWNWWKNEGRFVEGAGTSDPRFVGAHAVRAYEAARNASDGVGVPVENVGAQGTRDAHWREATFDTEIFTGYIDASPKLPISAVSIAALEDLGYLVNLDAADEIDIPDDLPPLRDIPPCDNDTAKKAFYCKNATMEHHVPSIPVDEENTRRVVWPSRPHD